MQNVNLTFVPFIIESSEGHVTINLNEVSKICVGETSVSVTYKADIATSDVFQVESMHADDLRGELNSLSSDI